MTNYLQTLVHEDEDVNDNVKQKELHVSAPIRVAARHPSFHSAFLQHSEHNINHSPEFFTQNKIIHGCVDTVRR